MRAKSETDCKREYGSSPTRWLFTFPKHTRKNEFPRIGNVHYRSLGSGSAYAIEIKRRTEIPGEPQTIWGLIGAFCAIKDWHPVVADCQETKEGDVTFRTLTLKDGGKIKEKLVESDDTSYSYEIVESPLPVKNYKAKFRVEPDDEPERTAVYWEAEFDANGATDEDARK
jgi:hypothetical protein